MNNGVRERISLAVCIWREGGREALDIVIRHDTSRPWDRHEPSPSIIRSTPSSAAYQEPGSVPEASRGEEREGERERKVILSSPGIRRCVVREIICSNGSYGIPNVPVRLLLTANRHHRRLGSPFTSKYLLRDKDCFDFHRSTRCTDATIYIYIYICLYVYMYLYIYIYARSGTVQLNHSLMDRPVNL